MTILLGVYAGTQSVRAGGPPTAISHTLIASTSRAERSKAIRSFARRWVGTPYQWGGTTRTGIDCSGFLRQMFRDLFGLELPRTTHQQIKLGASLLIDPHSPSKGLEPGDLIFYVDPEGTPNHVVVYVGRNQITHSVSRRGVVLDPISKLYGRRIVGRRFLVADPSPSHELISPLVSSAPRPEAVTIPCPSSYRPRLADVRRWRRHKIDSFETFESYELCDVRSLSQALARFEAETPKYNVAKLRVYAEWLNSLEALKEDLNAPFNQAF